MILIDLAIWTSFVNKLRLYRGGDAQMSAKQAAVFQGLELQ